MFFNELEKGVAIGLDVYTVLLDSQSGFMVVWLTRLNPDNRINKVKPIGANAVVGVCPELLRDMVVKELEVGIVFAAHVCTFRCRTLNWASEIVNERSTNLPGY